LHGIVLPKPNKEGYKSPALFHVIVLIQTISKIIKHITRSRLAIHARSPELINPNQCGSLAGISAAHIVTSLLNKVQTFQVAGYTVSTLFLDINGSFDNINVLICMNRLLSCNISKYLTAWTVTFLQNRQYALLFKGSPKTLSPVSIGVPQGSPISTQLFVINVAPLHIHVSLQSTLSYKDNFAIAVASKSVRQNTLLLLTASTEIQTVVSDLEVGFSNPKTELMHLTKVGNRIPVTPNSHLSTIAQIFKTNA
jgi:hypothetical protein